MPYFVNIPSDDESWTFQETLRRYEQYKEYLESIREKLPKSAYEFATASWHYGEDPRNPHDYVIQSFDLLQIKADSQGTHQEPSLDIRIMVNTNYEGGWLRLTYKSVHTLSLSTSEAISPIDTTGWRVDEIELSENGFVAHLVRFDCDINWRIECEDIEFGWEIVVSKE